MNSVSRVIARHLSAGRAIDIPNIGVLYCEQRGAQFIDDDRRLTSPVNEVAVGDFEAESIIDYMVSDLKTDENTAKEIYNRWVADSTVDGRLVIEGVCSIDLENFQIDFDKAFLDMINPINEDKIVVNAADIVDEPVTLYPSKKQNKTGVVIAIIVAIGAVAYLIYYFWDMIMEMLP